MPNFLSFMSSLASTVSSFLLSDPIVWFVGVFLLAGVVAVFHKAIR